MNLKKTIMVEKLFIAYIVFWSVLCFAGGVCVLYFWRVFPWSWIAAGALFSFGGLYLGMAFLCGRAVPKKKQ